MKNITGLSTAASIILVLTLSGCEQAQPPAEELTPRVKYFVVGEKATGQSRRISGKVVASDTTSLSFAVGGTVEEVLVSAGDSVREGQLLAKLDTEPMRLAVEQTRAQLNIARAKATETQQAFDRAVSLFEKGAGSRAEVETATANHEAARGNIRAVQSDLDRKERDFAQTTLSAPFSGTIASRSIDPFQETAVGSEVFIVQSSGSLEIEVSVPESMIRDIDYGQVVEVSFPTLSDAKATGIVSEISSRTEAGNAFPISVRLEQGEMDLRPGMTASVTFNFSDYLTDRTAYLIPLAAVAIEAGLIRQSRRTSDDEEAAKAPVFVIDSDNTLQLREVVTGDLRGNYLEVFDGLNEGEKIVSAGVALLREGLIVEPWSADQGLN